MLTRCKTVVFASALLSCFEVASAATYYVAPNGSDSQPGTDGAPFRTIAFAYSKVSAGDSIIVKPGVYTESLPGGYYCHKFSKLGSATAPITIKSERKWGAVLDGKNICHSIIWLNGSHHIIEGFQITNALNDGVVIYGTGYNRIVSNEIHHNGNKNANIPPPHAVSSGLSQAHTRGDHFIGNYIHHNGREASHTVFAQNLDHGMYLHGDDMLIANNIVANNRDHGIQLAGQGNLDNAKIFNNVLATNGRSGIMFWLTVRGARVVNNIFYLSGRGSAIDSYSPNVSDATFDRNIFFGHTTNIAVTGTQISIGTNYTTDPLFVNTPRGDFRARSADAIDHGLRLTEVPTDFAGVRRPTGNGYDIGAFEFGAPKVSPPRPTGFVVR